MTLSANRLVALATPLVFAPLAGAVTALAARYAPGVEIDEGQMQAIFIAGATIAFAKAGLWLKGWQDYEKAQDVPADALEHPNDMADVPAVTAAGMDEIADMPTEPALDASDADLEDDEDADADLEDDEDADDMVDDVDRAIAAEAPVAVGAFEDERV